jgi:cobalt-zinc-cadmium efflux system outer membrane protein
MSTGCRKSRCWLVSLLLLGGCIYPVREEADRAVDAMANQPIDAQPQVPPDTSMPYIPKAAPAPQPPQPTAGGLQQVSAQAKDPPAEKQPRRPLLLPPGFPGANAPDIRLPDERDPRYKDKPELYKKDVGKYIHNLYPTMPGVGPDPEPQPGPNGQSLTLADLQRLAMANSPLLRQAAADVEAARGTVLAAGEYPNPTLGYEADNVGTSAPVPGGGAGFEGAFLDQVIKTAGKLKLAQAAAQKDLDNARLALRRAQTDLMTQVRSGYFAVLVAQENIRINKLLVRFTDKVFHIQVDLTKDQAALYEPMALRALADQARLALMTARNHYVSSWKQLAANLGLPGMPPTEVAGHIDMPIPRFNFEQVLARVLSTHTDVLTARNTEQRARYNLRLAQVTPIPDVEVRLIVQQDWTTPPFLLTSGLQVGGPIPIWNHNKGGIIQAQGQLLRAVEESHRVRSALTTSLATAYETYDNNRRTVELYARRILPDQIRFYKGTYEQHSENPDRVGFNDIVTAQQALAMSLATYLTAVDATWQAVVTVANLLQTNELFSPGQETVDMHCTALDDLERLAPLPCCHPSNPLPDPRLKGGEGSWPQALPETASKGVPIPRVPKGGDRPTPPTPKPQAAVPGKDEDVAYIGKEQ